jgi:hypothetical protein
MMNIALLGCAIALTAGIGGPLREATTTTRLDVSTSEVAEDLRAFYNDKFPTNTLASLVPNKAAGDEYSDFKLINLYAESGSLYVYFYSAGYRYLFDGVILDYSDSTALSEDKASIVETWHAGNDGKSGSVMSSNGSRNRFYKAVIKDFYTYSVGSEHRVKAQSLRLRYNGETIVTRDCENHEYSWKDQATGEDQVYSYYKNSYVVINAMETVLNPIVTKYDSYSEKTAAEMEEMNWLFFSYSNTSKDADFDLGAVIGVRVAYDYLTYENTYRVNTGLSAHTSVYGGLLDDPNDFLQANAASSRDATFNVTNSARQESVVKPSNKRISRTTDKLSIFSWDILHHELNYSYQTLQSLDDSAVEAVKDSDFQNFLLRHKASYMYAINFRNDVRLRTDIKTDSQNFGEWFVDTRKVTSLCHEARSVDVVSLTFDSEAGELTLNGLSHPVEKPSMDSTQPSNPPVNDIFNNGLGKKLKDMGITLLAVGGAVLAIYLGFLIWRFFRLNQVGSAFRSGFSLGKKPQQNPSKSKGSKPIRGQWPKGK